MWRGEKAIVIRIIGNNENVTILAPIMADCGCVGLICGRLCRLVCSKFVFAKVGILNSVFQNRCLSKLVCFPESFSQIDVPESMIPNIDFPKLFPTIGFPELVFFPKDWLFKTVFPPKSVVHNGVFPTIGLSKLFFFTECVFPNRRFF